MLKASLNFFASFINCDYYKKDNNEELTSSIKDVDASAQLVKQSHVDQDPCSMVLDILGVFGAVVGVIPLIRWQQQLHQHVGHVCFRQGRMVGRGHGHRGQSLQQEAQKLLRETIKQHEEPMKLNRSIGT